MRLVPARRSGWSLEAARKRRPRGMVAHPRQRGGQNPAYRPSGNKIDPSLQGRSQPAGLTEGYSP